VHRIMFKAYQRGRRAAIAVREFVAQALLPKRFLHSLRNGAQQGYRATAISQSLPILRIR
jgi:hypothetical protein